MVHLPSSLAEIKVGDVSLFYCVDPNLGNLPLLIFYGLSTSTATTSNARIQVHIIHPAGAWSQPRLTVSPNSPIYDVVSYMDPFWQSDEVCRGLAYGINKFFGELSDGIKKAVITRNIEASSKRRSGSGTPQRDTPQRSTPQRSDQRRGYRDRSETPTTPTQSPSVELFSKQHAANLACSLVRIENVAEVLKDVEAGFRQQFLSNLDIDLVLPPGSIRPLSEGRNPEGDDEDFDEDKHQYGVYSALVKQFGEGCFLPTTKIKRAPSRALNRSKSFLKDQKLSLRREMSELVDTEERYVTKIYDLVYNVAEKFRKAARERHERSQSPSVEDVMRLFPKSLDEILQVNKGFLRAIQHVMDETEDAAMEDLEKDEPTFSRRRFDGGRQRDPTGAAAFAKVMLEWFPKFFDCYQNYIRASGHFPDLLSTWMRQPSSFSQRVKSSGEQKLKSSIIEPVQRLPRYSLYIDNIVNYLPATHPAQAQMLKARDIITAICSLDPRETDKENPQIWQRLKAMVYNWPSTFQPQGRLISAVDFVEMAAPYHLSANAPGSVNGILLLFADSVVVCKCSRDSTVSARGVLAEVDKPSTAAMMAAVSNATSGSAQALASKGLIFMERYPLNSARFTESDDNRAVWLTNSLSLEKNPQTPCRRAFLLRGAYDGKAFKWSEEVAKARIEGRFSDQERESDNWELRHVVLKDAGLNVYTSVFAEGIDSLIEGRKDPAPLRIVVDREKGTKGAPVGHYGVEIAGNISVIEHQGHVSYHVTFDGLNDRRFSDFADDSTLASTFCKRVSSFIQYHFSAKNPALTQSFIAYHVNILTALKVQVRRLEQPKPEPARPSSPIKFLGSFLGMTGTTSAPVADTETKKLRRTPVFGSIPNLSASSLTRSNSKKDAEPAPKKDVDSASTTATSSFNTSDTTGSNPLVRLEETLNAYVRAIASRKGNVVGRIIHNRAAADELAVNAIYNTLIEDPFDQRAPAEATVDVLFRAFEKFLHMAWHLQMGPVVSVLTLQQLQENSSSMRGNDYATHIHEILMNLAPQNRRAFAQIIRLLCELLEGCGNDADRGILTAAFSELIVLEDSHRWINLLDRLVDEFDEVFKFGATTSQQNTPHGSVNSTMRGNMSAQAGSVTSQTSSFRRRFGFDTLLRTNSKRDDDQKSSWRLHKSKASASNYGSPESYSKASLHRTISTDTSAPSSPERPKSSHRPTILGAFGDMRPQSAQHLSPTNAASPPPYRPTTMENQRTIKKKRRSSLSDLRTLMAEAAIKESPESPPARTNSAQPDMPATSPLAERRKNHNPSPKPQPMIYGSPRTPSPIKPSLQRETRYNSPNLKENTPLNSGNGSIRGAPNTSPQTAIKVNERARVQDLWAMSEDGKRLHKYTASLDTYNLPHQKAHLPTPLKPSGAMPKIQNLPPAPKSLEPAPAFGRPAFTEMSARHRKPSPIALPQTKARSVGVSGGSRSGIHKLRLQSPSKIRANLKEELNMIDEKEANLQKELSSISREMARLSGGRTGSDASRHSETTSSQNIPRTDEQIAKAIQSLRERLRFLESETPSWMWEMHRRNDELHFQLERSLVNAVALNENMKKVYDNAVAENTVLYERINKELVKIVNVLRKKGKEEDGDMVDRILAAEMGAARLHAENMELRHQLAIQRSLITALDLKEDEIREERRKRMAKEKKERERTA